MFFSPQYCTYVGLQIYVGFGQTEASSICGMCYGMEPRPGSIGKPMPGYNLKVLLYLPYSTCVVCFHLFTKNTHLSINLSI